MTTERYARTLVHACTEVSREYPSWVRAASRSLRAVSAVNAALLLEQRESRLQHAVRVCVRDATRLHIIDLADTLIAYYNALDAVLGIFEKIAATTLPTHHLNAFMNTWLEKLEAHEELTNRARVAAAYCYAHFDCAPLVATDVKMGLEYGFGPLVTQTAEEAEWVQKMVG